jgi:hypothetical protein
MLYNSSGLCSYSLSTAQPPNLLQECFQSSNFLLAFQPLSKPFILRVCSESLLVESNGRFVPLYRYVKSAAVQRCESRSPYCQNPPFDSAALSLSGDPTQVSEEELANSCISAGLRDIEVFKL